MELYGQPPSPPLARDQFALVAGIVRHQALHLVRNRWDGDDNEGGNDEHEPGGHDGGGGPSREAPVDQEYDDGVEPDGNEQGNANDDEDARYVRHPPKEDIGHSHPEGPRESDEEGGSPIKRSPQTAERIVAAVALLLNARREHQDAGRSFLAVARPEGRLAHGDPDQLLLAKLRHRWFGMGRRLNVSRASGAPPAWTTPADEDTRVASPRSAGRAERHWGDRTVPGPSAWIEPTSPGTAPHGCRHPMPFGRVSVPGTGAELLPTVDAMVPSPLV